MGLGDHNVHTHTHAHAQSDILHVREAGKTPGLYSLAPDAAGYHGDPRWKKNGSALCLFVLFELPI